MLALNDFIKYFPKNLRETSYSKYKLEESSRCVNLTEKGLVLGLFYVVFQTCLFIIEASLECGFIQLFYFS